MLNERFLSGDSLNSSALLGSSEKDGSSVAASPGKCADHCAVHYQDVGGLLAADYLRVDVEQIRRAAGGLGECVDETGSMVNSFHGASRLEFAFGMSPEGERASAEYHAMHDSLQNMLIGLHDLGKRHRDTLESLTRLYRDVDGDATALTGSPTREDG